ncbi:MAG: exo-alpha-sialidase [Phycisphaerales bacterium]|nr:exo-alpha-sialidase [Phycisphaerales bacterium]
MTNHSGKVEVRRFHTWPRESRRAPGGKATKTTGCYAPYHTFDATLKVDRNQVVAMRSTDQGRSWNCHAMLRFEQTDSGGAEAWVVELTDGRLLGTSWHIDHTPAQQRFANAYAVSTDGGRSWKPTRSTGLYGNTTVLAPLNDGSALFGFVQRGDDLAAISIAKVRPTPDDFGIEAQQVVFRADQSTRSGKTAEDNQWKDFSFGEPSITVLDGGEVLVTYWCIDGDFAGIRSIRLRLVK